MALLISLKLLAVAGDGCIAIIDDGVQLNHEDLNIWTNPGETNANNNSDEDNNGYIDDWRGWDFVIDSSTNNRLQDSNLNGSGTCGSDGLTLPGEDNNPSPQATSDCALPFKVMMLKMMIMVPPLQDWLQPIGNNNRGVAGTAYSAEILPIRLISDFDTLPISSFPDAVQVFVIVPLRRWNTLVAYADVVNNSWTMPDQCVALETAIANVTGGTVNVNGGQLTSKRPSPSGSPVICFS